MFVEAAKWLLALVIATVAVAAVIGMASAYVALLYAFAAIAILVFARYFHDHFDY